MSRMHELTGDFGFWISNFEFEDKPGTNRRPGGDEGPGIWRVQSHRSNGQGQIPSVTLDFGPKHTRALNLSVSFPA